MSMMGIRKNKVLTEKEILRCAEKYKIPIASTYELDSSYARSLFSLDSSKFKQQIKDHYQPLQVLYYNTAGQLISYQVNCYAGGFPNLKWNRNNGFASFPPKTLAPTDSLIPLRQQLDHLRLLSGSSPLPQTENEMVVLVFWSRFMGRQSKRLIQLVQNNAQLSPEKKIRILYANNDNLYASPQGGN